MEFESTANFYDILTPFKFYEYFFHWYDNIDHKGI